MVGSKLMLASFLSASICACASQERVAQSYQASAQHHEQSAEDWRGVKNEVMTEYHKHEAEKARHNGTAASCGFFDLLLHELLSSDNCRSVW